MLVITTNLLNRFWKNGVKPIATAVMGKFDAAKVVASKNITEPGYVMDGKTASEEFAGLNRKRFELLFEISDFSEKAYTVSDITQYKELQLIINTTNGSCTNIIVDVPTFKTLQYWHLTSYNPDTTHAIKGGIKYISDTSVKVFGSVTGYQESKIRVYGRT